MHKPFLSPRNDLVFRLLFGDARDTSILTAWSYPNCRRTTGRGCGTGSGS
jgi:hypothetical protein